MKRFIAGEDRQQVTLLPDCLDDYVTEDNPVRLVEAFVDELDLIALGFVGAVPEVTGRPAYHPAALLKIYLYGYLNRVPSPSGYYSWRSRPESARSASNHQLLDDGRRIHAGHHRRYGAPRVHAALRAEGRSASRGRVERLMRRHGIRALAGRRFRPCTTDSRHDLSIAPNLLKQDFSAARPNTVWLADLT